MGLGICLGRCPEIKPEMKLGKAKMQAKHGGGGGVNRGRGGEEKERGSGLGESSHS